MHTMLSANEIRSRFLEFFRERGHQIVPSAPVVVKNDPTLLFTNAGMNQFKDYFLGNKTPEHNRVADTQKCLRVSGKHNDLEEVGVDTYHHTLFEMLGNWSFGDYFKKEAIAWSWELLTKAYGIPAERLYVTYFEGDPSESLPADKETYDFWLEHVDPARILPGSKKDNFWEMGETGPCGPCSEIHVDCRADEERSRAEGKTLVNADHPQVIEIWNNVFMEFNRLKNGSLEPLPAKHVDTGMGLERLVRVLQQKQSNYDTDLFTGTIGATERLTGLQYDAGDSKQAVAFRVIADHIRAIAFTIADGQLPSNTGAGYVIRRILRRAVRYYYSSLQYREPLLYQLIPGLAAQFSDVFPELQQQESFVARVIREEEEAFLKTLEKGLRRIDELVSSTTSGTAISGRDAFELYDTYGFPADLTRLIAGEHGMEVDEAGFRAEMQQQKDRSRAATALDTDDWVIVHEAGTHSFVGYADYLVETRVHKYRKVKAKGRDFYQIVLEQTPFYAESGGQTGDTGLLVFADGEKIAVTDTRKENDLTVHITTQLPADISTPVTAQIHVEKRFQAAYNHTATHLLHAALRQVLGTHVTQKGSLVSPDVLRFDFAHFSRLSDEELREVQSVVNEKIRANLPVIIREMPRDEAMQLGAMALFGEKYGNTVRVVTIDPEFSVELCGGTHVGHTGMIGVFALTSEASVSAGVRRIEALTGPSAIRFLAERVGQHKQLTELLKTKDPLKTINKILEDKAALEKRLEAMEQKLIAVEARQLAEHAEQLGEITFVGKQIAADSADSLKKLCFALKQYLPSHYVAVLTADIAGKANVAILIGEQLAETAALDARLLIRDTVSPLINGGGGGQQTLATAGGKDTGNLQQVIEEIKKRIKQAISKK